MLLLIISLMAVLFTVAVIRGRHERKRNIEKRMKSSWGTKVPQLFSDDILLHAKDLSDAFQTDNSVAAECGNCCEIDRTTAEDLDLDSLFLRAVRTASSAGAEVLYLWLTHPLLEAEKLKERTGLEDYFAGNGKDRLRVYEVLSNIGFLKNNSFYGAVSCLDRQEKIGYTSYLFLSILTAACLILLFIAPAPAICALIPVLFFDFRIHLRMKDRIGAGLEGLHAVRMLLDAAEKLAGLEISALSKYSDVFLDVRREFSWFRRSFFIVGSGSSVNTGIGDAILEYVKMFFHIDLLCYDRMLTGFAGHRDSIVRLLMLTGGIDAAISAASFRESFTPRCEPEFAGQELSFENLYHPLLDSPVPNSLTADRGILITGSNASGKSTFLKSIGIAAILAQSLGFAPAVSYKAPFYRIMTSMAVKDNLSAGESYFTAELNSLRRICDASVISGPPVLALTDEVLRGTNTIERIAASASVLEEAARGNIQIFAATHDRELTVLLDGIYRNVHFGETIQDGDVVFDYLLKEGPAEGRNAIRLLRKTGFNENIAKRAEERALRFDRTGEWE